MSSNHTEHVAPILEMVARQMSDTETYEVSGPALVFLLYMWKDALNYALEQVEASID